MVDIALDHRNPCVAGLDNAVNVWAARLINHEHVRTRRHDLRYADIVELDDVVDKLLLIGIDLPLVMDEFDKGNQLLLGDIGGARELPGNFRDKIQKQNQRIEQK